MITNRSYQLIPAGSRVTFWHKKKGDKYSHNIKAILIDDAYSGMAGTVRAYVKIDGQVEEVEIYQNRIFLVHHDVE